MLVFLMPAEVRSNFIVLIYPRRAASIAAMSILVICIIASKARLAAAGSGSVIASDSAIGVICQDSPHLSLHQPQALSAPPLPGSTDHQRQTDRDHGETGQER